MTRWLCTAQCLGDMGLDMSRQLISNWPVSKSRETNNCCGVPFGFPSSHPQNGSPPKKENRSKRLKVKRLVGHLDLNNVKGSWTPQMDDGHLDQPPWVQAEKGVDWQRWNQTFVLVSTCGSPPKNNMVGFCLLFQPKAKQTRFDAVGFPRFGSKVHNRFLRMNANGIMDRSDVLNWNALNGGYTSERFTVVDAQDGQVGRSKPDVLSFSKTNIDQIHSEHGICTPLSWCFKGHQKEPHAMFVIF